MLLRGPYKDCPHCHSHTQGVDWICDKAYWRRCSTCGKKEYILLPQLSKTILYLDQFAVSKLSFVSDKNHQKHKRQVQDSFWPELYNLLSEAVQTQAVVCPESCFHLKESAVTGNFDGFHLLAHQLAGGTSFQSTYAIQRRQLLLALRNFMTAPESVPAADDGQGAFNQDTNVWLPRIQVQMLKRHYPKNAAVYREDRERVGNGLTPLYLKWKKERKDIIEWVHEEAQGYICSIYEKFFETWRQGGLTYGMMHPMSDFLVALFAEARIIAPSDEEAMGAVVDFLQVRNVLQVPYIRVQSFLYAAMARKIAAGQFSFKPSITNDVAAIATVYPYTDAMLLDRECAALLREQPLATELPWKSQIFTEAKPDRSRLLAFVETCINSRPEDVKQAVAELYGKARAA